MKASLARHKPSDCTQEEWEKHWSNSKYTLDPLVAAVEGMMKEVEDVKEDDFESPNHYAKLMFRAGQLKMAKKVVDLICS